MFAQLKPCKSASLRLTTLIVINVVVVSTVMRILLLLRSWPSVDLHPGSFTGIFAFGLLYDIVTAAYFSIPLVLYLWLIPGRVLKNRFHQYAIGFGFYLFIFLLLFSAVSEWFFWDEFHTRFNFIAVDYLVYTTEVIGNIRQSYPVDGIIVLLALLSIVPVYFYRHWFVQQLVAGFKHRTYQAAALFSLPLLSFLAINNKYHRFSPNEYINELAGNGIYELFSAYLNNELNYEQFYKRMDNNEAFDRLHHLLVTTGSEFPENNLGAIQREIQRSGEEKRLHVVLISVESLSAGFLGTFGNDQNITPNLDSLTEKSLVFTRLYATGTRTVRGLEALSLCVPPTPGQSIVRRPGNEHLFSLATVFNQKGYESKFIYGGYGYFDNMNYFFANNGYEVIDRTALDKSEIDYENIWGVADENLFTLAMREIEKTVNKRKPVFAHIMTTSNHRPFTYPEGRIDIPSHTGREGAVKYTDYAIGKFIREASGKKWFYDAIFVIVADHCASSAGKTTLPIGQYHIPLLIYSPAHIQPGKTDRLMSQIDVGPTVLGLLNFSYATRFYGYDMTRLEPGRERIFISTYQNLGYIRDNKMVVLSPRQKVAVFTIDFTNHQTQPADEDTALTREAIAWYQSASVAFKNGWMRTP